MKTVAALLFFCATAAASPTVTFVHTAAGSYGVQKSGEDAGPLYAFVKVESDKPDSLVLSDVFVTLDKKVCAKQTKISIAKIPPAKDPNAQLRVDASKGTPFTGSLQKGTTWLRIEAAMNHQCAGEPLVHLIFGSGHIPTEVTRKLDARLPA